MLNEAYKKQIGLVREESELKLQVIRAFKASTVGNFVTKDKKIIVADNFGYKR
jgi:hypothetical protein